MEIINQLAGSLAQSAAVTRQQSTDKSQQVRRAQALRKDVAAAPDSFEHQVESCEELTPIHDEQQRKKSGNRGKKRAASDSEGSNAKPDDDAPHVDVTV
jgi:hypothetical protein